MSNLDELVKLVLKRVMEQLGKTNLYIAGETSSQVIKSYLKETHTHYNVCEISDEAEVLLLTKTSARVMAEIARGYGELADACLAIDFLATGRRVVCLSEGLIYKKYEDTCSKKLYEKWLAYEAEAKALGLEIQSLSDFIATRPVADEKSVAPVAIKGKLITENCFVKAGIKEAQTVEISKNAIVTPLAQDYIRQAHLTLVSAETE